MEVWRSLIVVGQRRSNEGVFEQPGSRPAARGIALKTAQDEVLEVRGSRRRSLGRLRHTNGAHETGPIALPPNREGEPSHVELQYANPKAPYVPCVRVVLPVVYVRIDPLRTHVGDRPHRRIARIHRLIQYPTHPEVSDLHLLPRVYKQIRRLDVPVDDVPPVQVRQPPKNLPRQICQLLLLRDVFPLQRTSVHELQQHLDFAVLIVHLVTLHHVRIVHVTEDLDFPVDLPPHRLLVVTVYHLQRVHAPARAVDHLVHRPAAPAPDAVQSLQLRERDHLLRRLLARSAARRRSRRRRWRQRKWHRQVGVSLRQRQREVLAAALGTLLLVVVVGGGRGRVGPGSGRRWQLHRPHLMSRRKDESLSLVKYKNNDNQKRKEGAEEEVHKITITNPRRRSNHASAKREASGN